MYFKVYFYLYYVGLLTVGPIILCRRDRLTCGSKIKVVQFVGPRALKTELVHWGKTVFFINNASNCNAELF